VFQRTFIHDCKLFALDFYEVILLKFGLWPGSLSPHRKIRFHNLSVNYTLYTIHYTLYTIHYTLYTIHYTLYTIHYTLYIIHYTLYIIHYNSRVFLPADGDLTSPGLFCSDAWTTNAGVSEGMPAKPENGKCPYLPLT